MARMATHRVFVFGNEDIALDALPLRLVPYLRTRFPHVSFEVLDPNEEWDAPSSLIILDTVVNLVTPTMFEDLSPFTAAPRVTCHDFDAYTNLLLLMKLGVVHQVTLLGLPPSLPEHIARAWIERMLPPLLTNAAHETAAPPPRRARRIQHTRP